MTNRFMNIAIEKGIDKDPWILTSILDKHNIFLSIDVKIHKDVPSFSYSITTPEKTINSDNQQETRFECLTEAVSQCISILEKILSSTNNIE